MGRMFASEISRIQKIPLEWGKQINIHDLKQKGGCLVLFFGPHAFLIF